MNRKLKWLLMLSLAAVGTLWFIGGRLRAAENEGATDDDGVAALERESRRTTSSNGGL